MSRPQGDGHFEGEAGAHPQLQHGSRLGDVELLPGWGRAWKAACPGGASHAESRQRPPGMAESPCMRRQPLDKQRMSKHPSYTFTSPLGSRISVVNRLLAP